DRFEHLLRQGRSIAAGDEDRNHCFVEGMQEREQAADQDPRTQHRRVTKQKVASGPAPALMAARSRLRSKPLSAAAMTRKATGIESTLCATIMPACVPTRRARLRKL